MYLIVLFGALMMALSATIIIWPGAWADGIVRFSQWRWFHPFEVLTRLAFGIAFLKFGPLTANPATMEVIGWVLVAVGIGLALTPPSLHRKFALWSAHAFRHIFRPAGIATLLFGGFIVLSALRGYSPT
jgi:hypothetical protein